MFPPAKDRSIQLSFLCKACGQQFSRKIGKIYVHAPDFLEQVRVKSGSKKLTSYIIPQPIICSKCNTSNQYDLTNYSRNSLTMSLLATMMVGQSPDGLVEAITFVLFDGTPMHPADAVAHYQKQLANNSEDVILRIRLANALRTIGHWDEAEQEYLAAVDQDPGQLEAWINLTAIYSGRKQKRNAKKMLSSLVANAPAEPMSTPGRELVDYAQALLDGLSPIEELTPQSLLQSAEKTKSKRRRKKKS